MSDKVNICTKHHTSYVTECHSCYREKTECIHGVPFDSECGECEECGELSKLYGMTSDYVEACHHGVPFKHPISCVKCYEEQKEILFEHFTIEEVSCKEKLDSSLNNGGRTDYYQLDSAPFNIKDFDDFAEWRCMNGNQFNMGKVMWTFNVGRHNGTDYERDLNKIIHYAQRELLRINR